jgi:hypothetical protein
VGGGFHNVIFRKRLMVLGFTLAGQNGTLILHTRRTRRIFFCFFGDGWQINRANEITGETGSAAEPLSKKERLLCRQGFPEVIARTLAFHKERVLSLYRCLLALESASKFPKSRANARREVFLCSFPGACGLI